MATNPFVSAGITDAISGYMEANQQRNQQIATLLNEDYKNAFNEDELAKGEDYYNNVLAANHERIARSLGIKNPKPLPPWRPPSQEYYLRKNLPLIAQGQVMAANNPTAIPGLNAAYMPLATQAGIVPPAQATQPPPMPQLPPMNNIPFSQPADMSKLPAMPTSVQPNAQIPHQNMPYEKAFEKPPVPQTAPYLPQPATPTAQAQEPFSLFGAGPKAKALALHTLGKESDRVMKSLEREDPESVYASTVDEMERLSTDAGIPFDRFVYHQRVLQTANMTAAQAGTQATREGELGVKQGQLGVSQGRLAETVAHDRNTEALRSQEIKDRKAAEDARIKIAKVNSDLRSAGVKGELLLKDAQIQRLKAGKQTEDPDEKLAYSIASKEIPLIDKQLRNAQSVLKQGWKDPTSHQGLTPEQRKTLESSVQDLQNQRASLLKIKRPATPTATASPGADPNSPATITLPPAFFADGSPRPLPDALRANRGQKAAPTAKGAKTQGAVKLQRFHVKSKTAFLPKDADRIAGYFNTYPDATVQDLMQRQGNKHGWPRSEVARIYTIVNSGKQQ